MLCTKARSIGRRFWFFAALVQRRTAFAGPHEGIERKALDALGMALCEQRRAQCPGRNAVHQKALDAARLHDVLGGGSNIIGAVRNIEVDRAIFVRSPVAFRIETPGVEALLHEIVHRRGMRTSGHLQIERRLRGHRRAVHE
jgi:hypothetical protein